MPRDPISAMTTPQLVRAYTEIHVRSALGIPAAPEEFDQIKEIVKELRNRGILDSERPDTQL